MSVPAYPGWPYRPYGPLSPLRPLAAPQPGAPASSVFRSVSGEVLDGLPGLLTAHLLPEPPLPDAGLLSPQAVALDPLCRGMAA